MNSHVVGSGVGIVEAAGVAALLLLFAVIFGVATIWRRERSHSQRPGHSSGVILLAFAVPCIAMFFIFAGTVFLVYLREQHSAPPPPLPVVSSYEKASQNGWYEPEPVVVIQRPGTTVRAGASSVEITQPSAAERRDQPKTVTTESTVSTPAAAAVLTPVDPVAPEPPATAAAPTAPVSQEAPVSDLTAAPSKTSDAPATESASGIIAEVTQELHAAGVEISTDLNAAAIEIRDEVGNAMREVSSELMGEVAGLQAELAGKRSELDSVISQINAALSTPLFDEGQQAERLSGLKNQMRGLREELRRTESKLSEHVRELAQLAKKKGAEAKTKAEMAAVERDRSERNRVRVQLFGKEMFGKRRSPNGQPQLIPEVVVIQHRGEVAAAAPGWATPEGAASVGENQFVVSSQRFATLPEAELQLTSAVLDRAYQVLSSQSNQFILSPGLIDQYAVKECVAERMEKDFGELAGKHEMFRVHALVEMTPQVRDLAGDLWRIEEVRSRTRILGIGAAALIGMVIVTAMSLSARRGVAFGILVAILGLGFAIAGALIGLAS